MKRAAVVTVFPALALALATAAIAKPPPAGVLIPGKSLGGVRLGMTPAQVRASWGSDFGRCRGCRHTTWYYNYAPFTPKGAGVEIRGGRVAAVFTLWAPSSWHTPRRLRIGDPAARVTQLYGALPQVHCAGYDALTMPGSTTTSFFIREGNVWGFGLSRAGVPVCR